MNNPDAFALLVGVGRYDAFDPTGAANLHGPPHDVQAWWRIARDLGIPPENIRVCADPAPVVDGLPGWSRATITGATRAELVDALGWLAARLDGVDGQKALLTWSSHGTRTPEGQVFCPSDLTAEGTTLHNALTTTEVKALLGRRAPRTRVTAFVDTCHNATGFTDDQIVGRALPWPHAAPAATHQPDAVGHGAFGDLVVSSSEPGTVSYEVPAVGVIRGGFSFTASNLIHRWGAADAAGGATAGLTYATLVKGTRVMLRGLAVPQSPVYIGDPLLADTRVFSSFGDRVIGDAPAQTLDGSEIWPGVPTGKVYSAPIHTSDGKSRMGTLFLTGDDAPKGWTSNTQYWEWNNSNWQDGWPTSSGFEVDAPTEMSSPGSPPTGNVSSFGLSSLVPVDPSESYTLPVGAWSIAVESGSKWVTIGYMWINIWTNSLYTFSVQSAPASTLLAKQQPLQFGYLSGSTSIEYTASATDT